MKEDRVVYSLNIEDVQTVAKDKIGRKLTAVEVEDVENRIGDYIDWYEAISFAIDDKVKTKRKNKIE